MGLSRIFGFFAAVVSVSALAADPPVPRSNVSVNVNPTTSYYTATNSTLRLPNGVSTVPTSGALPVVSKYSGGLQQTIPMGVTIDAIKKSAPLPAVVRSTTSSLKGAATRCLTSAKCNIGLILAGEGLNRLFDGLDWVMGEGAQIQKKGEPPSDIDTSKLHYAVIDAYNNKMGIGYTPKQACFDMLGRSRNGRKVQSIESYSDTKCFYWAAGGYGFEDNIRKYGSVCPVGSVFNGVNCDFEGSPVSAAEIASGVDSSYVPEPTDWPALTPELQPDDIEITSAPTLQGEPKTVTHYDADGNPHKVTETNIWYDFDIRDNPSPKPTLDLKIREETKTYENGELTGTTTTESTASGGSGVPPAPELDIPTDCDFMPTVCAFLEWYRDDDDPEEPDLSVLIDDRDFTKTYTISGGSKQCPPDFEFTVDFIGRTYGLSFEPACDFASKMYYFVMAAAYIFAAYITIGAARNG